MFLNSIKVGIFLAFRQIKRTTIWTTSLIIFIMTLTFLNLVVVSGVLLGLVEGSSNAYRAQYSADILIKPQPLKKYIENSSDIVAKAFKIPGVFSVSVRYLEGVQLEANYKKLPQANSVPDQVGAILTGIDPNNEQDTTNLSALLVEGRYLESTDKDVVMLGSGLLKKYTFGAITGQALEYGNVGDKLRLNIGKNYREVTIVGVIKSKIGDVNQRAYMNELWFKKVAVRSVNNSNEIAIKLKPNIDYLRIKNELVKSNLGKSPLVQTWEESQGQFFKQLASTFVILGNFIGGIALAVSSVTIFIVIFINAITRRKYIGILKGIGVKGTAITISYLLQSLFYSTIGSILGLALLYGFLKPYFDANPIDFPFSDGILVATFAGTMLRVGLLFLATVIAGFIPARLIISKNTLDSILGR